MIVGIVLVPKQSAAGDDAVYVRMVVQVLAHVCNTIKTPTDAPSRFGLAATSRSVADAAAKSSSYSAVRLANASSAIPAGSVNTTWK